MSLQTTCDIICALMRSPQTMAEIAKIVDCNLSTSCSTLHALHDAGLVQRSRRPGDKTRAILWVWQAEPFALEDES